MPPARTAGADGPTGSFGAGNCRCRSSDRASDRSGLRRRGSVELCRDRGLPLIRPWLPVIWACFPAALWLIVKSLLGEVPLPRRGALPFCLAGIGLEIVIFLTLSHSLPLIFAAALLLGAAAILAVPRVERSTVLVLMAAGAVLGPVCEALPVAAGAWSYAQPDVLGLPLWLPLAYALFAVLVAYGARSLAEGDSAK